MVALLVLASPVTNQLQEKICMSFRRSDCRLAIFIAEIDAIVEMRAGRDSLATAAHYGAAEGDARGAMMKDLVA
jgi:hypothetical protein